ncbi:MAG: outer membrane lipoprotein-sorting protein [Candidatus Krumholzibacteriota bacterium]|nr:outer membrane lipoprotein-sorting protein [Candidatus Krumholzibacteriota bacterium]
MRYWPTLVILWMMAAPAAEIQAPTGEEVLERIDRNMYLDQAISTATMVIHGRSATRTLTSKTYRQGLNQAFVEYLSPPREKGKKMLRLADKLWTYTPEPTDRIITISGHLLRQSVMGSDLSYEDITENRRLRELYDARVTGQEEIDGRRCWILSLTAKTEDVTYHARTLWVDQERWLPLKEDRFARSGRLLKTIRIEEVFPVGERWYPKRMTFRDMLSRGDGTEYTIDTIDIEVDIPDHLFSKSALRQ